MMSQPKPLASLSSGLLARKGQAKPAMRPQGYSGFGAVSDAIDDLGWNDMGHNESQPGLAAALPAELPPVLRERQELAEEITFAAAAPVAEPVVAPAATGLIKQPTRSRAAPERRAGSKSAFTLRLDAERHLRLRLATVLRRQSAQQLMVEALDNFLETLPEVEAMANRLSCEGRNDMHDGG